ncbi:SDR family oxidoreductase [Bradyrhizobium sp. CCBAU 51753]|uniref:SDR family oxidoreductase n=1 Tax=Bradyrhizobium sp. CCBAU 51753 TaxID=1325100 RepID=UPI00188DABC4|nr:SDR family oxidoreductase [Bradyrhizobium sp. CCBAU 51753]QOZ26669.1 short-chain dehydrogenase [Bradyrhizobium sp. CCBAU 51753]
MPSRQILVPPSDKERPLQGKVAFVAGASGGINLAIGRALANAGASIAIVSRSQERISQAARNLLADGHEAIGLVADVRDYGPVESALAQTVERFGNIDIVVSGAAGNFLAPAMGMSANAFRTVVDIDLIGTFNVLRAAFPYLRRPGASLISITAPQGATPSMFQAHACAAKAGINMLTKCLAMEWGPAGIRVNAISPGPIADTVGMARLAPTAELEAQAKKRIPLRDYGTKEDVANVAVFLASDLASYITGAILNCDGGVSLGDASADAIDFPPPGPRQLIEPDRINVDRP